MTDKPLTIDEIIAEVDSKSRGRTRHNGSRQYYDEELVAEVKRLRLLIHAHIDATRDMIALAASWSIG